MSPSILGSQAVPVLLRCTWIAQETSSSSVFLPSCSFIAHFTACGLNHFFAETRKILAERYHRNGTRNVQFFLKSRSSTRVSSDISSSLQNPRGPMPMPARLGKTKRSILHSQLPRRRDDVKVSSSNPYRVINTMSWREMSLLSFSKSHRGKERGKPTAT
jgi:hypothetical protein